MCVRRHASWTDLWSATVTKAVAESPSRLCASLGQYYKRAHQSSSPRSEHAHLPCYDESHRSFSERTWCLAQTCVFDVLEKRLRMQLRCLPTVPEMLRLQLCSLKCTGPCWATIADSRRLHFNNIPQWCLAQYKITVWTPMAAAVRADHGSVDADTNQPRKVRFRFKVPSRISLCTQCTCMIQCIAFGQPPGTGTVGCSLKSYSLTWFSILTDWWFWGGPLFYLVYYQQHYDHEFQQTTILDCGVWPKVRFTELHKHDASFWYKYLRGIMPSSQACCKELVFVR